MKILVLQILGNARGTTTQQVTLMYEIIKKEGTI